MYAALCLHEANIVTGLSSVGNALLCATFFLNKKNMNPSSREQKDVLLNKTLFLFKVIFVYKKGKCVEIYMQYKTASKT